MDIRQMRYFVAVAEEKSFTKAADKLFIAQPPLSRAIKNLEDELEVSLLIRNTRNLELTEAGKYFYSHAKKIIQSEIQLKKMTRKIGGLSQVIKIGYVGSTIYSDIAVCIRRFKKDYPDIAIDLKKMNTAEQISSLNQGEIDIGVGRIKNIDPSIEYLVLKEERLYVALFTSHPLATAQHQSLNLEQVVNDSLLLYPDTEKPNFQSSIMDMFALKMLTPTNESAPLDTVQSALNLVMMGLGITIVSEGVANYYNKDLVFKPLQESFALTPLLLTYRKHASCTVTNNFIALCEQEFGRD